MPACTRHRRISRRRAAHPVGGPGQFLRGELAGRIFRWCLQRRVVRDWADLRPLAPNPRRQTCPIICPEPNLGPFGWLKILGHGPHALSPTVAHVSLAAPAQPKIDCCKESHTCTSGPDPDFKAQTRRGATELQIHWDKSHPGRPLSAGPIHCVHQFSPRAVKARRPTRRSPRLCRP